MSRSATGAVVSENKRMASQAAAGRNTLADSRQSPSIDRRRTGGLARPDEPKPARRRSALRVAAAPLERPAWEVCDARAGDHPSIYQWLLAVFHGPSRDEFHAEQDDPTYQPANRMLIKRGSRIVSHAQLLARTMNFGSVEVPAACLTWFGTLPEFRHQGAGSRLLAAGDAKMRALGAEIGLLRTRVPHFFRRAGWAVWSRHCYSRANAREILAHYWADPSLRRDALNIRLWRHFEMPALMRIYSQNTSDSFGPFQRHEPYWRWLISRGAFDHVVIALAGPDRLDLNETNAPIVGYAAIHRDRVVELLTNPAYPTAAIQLLARACSDALERRGNDITLEAPESEALHRFVRSASGLFHHHEVNEQEVYMAKVLDIEAFLDRLRPLMGERLKAAGYSKPVELGICTEQEKLVLAAGPRGISVCRGRLGRSYLTCSQAELTRLLLGHSSASESASQGRLEASTALALELADVLFPRLPIWRPVWDDLIA